MADYLKLVCSLQAQFMSVKVTQISRGQNSHVDSLATLASSVGSSIPRIISVESLESMSINRQEHCQVTAIVVSPSWMDPIILFISNETLPMNKSMPRR